MVTFLAFVRPALLRMMGCTPRAAAAARRSTEALRKKPGRTEYQRGIVSTAADGTLQVRTTGNQGSGVLSSMVQANGLIVLHHDQGNVAVGDVVDVMVFDGDRFFGSNQSLPIAKSSFRAIYFESSVGVGARRPDPGPRT
jgi:molybdopterin molybdotransferase